MFMTHRNINSTITKQALSQAEQAMGNAYAPYSKFHVGAVILADDGQLYAGCNVENAAYPQGQCAESSAIGAMITAGAKRIDAIWIMGMGNMLVPPCGGCRQRIREFANPETPIYICCPERGVRITTNLSKMLPHSFAPENLDDK